VGVVLGLLSRSLIVFIVTVIFVSKGWWSNGEREREREREREKEREWKRKWEKCFVQRHCPLLRIYMVCGRWMEYEYWILVARYRGWIKLNVVELYNLYYSRVSLQLIKSVGHVNALVLGKWEINKQLWPGSIRERNYMIDIGVDVRIRIVWDQEQTGGLWIQK